MMEKLEKVRMGLKCCVKRNPDDVLRCHECPYEGACINRLKYDALNVLTPRVYKFEELSDRMTGWLEYMGDVIPVIGGRSVPGAHCFIDAIDRSLALVDDQYNVTWRVWTLEPSEDERKAAEWDAGGDE